MKRAENRIAPFEKFAWDNSKGKLVIKLSPKAIENPLLLHIEFRENTELFCLGEEKAVRQIAENPDQLTKHKGSVLMLSEKRPLGSLLMYSYDFVTKGLQSVTNIFRSMLHSIDSGNSEKASDYKMLEKLWREGNTFQRIVINYLFYKFYRVKHFAANGTAGIFAYSAERRQQMYSELEQSMEQEFSLLEHNPTTLSDLKQLRYYKKTDHNEKIFCSNLAEFYVHYIFYLSDCSLFFRVCPRCVESRSLPPHRDGDTTANVQDSKISITSSKASTTLNATIFTSSARRKVTATIIFAVVSSLSAGIKDFKPSTSHSTRNLKMNWLGRKRNCRAKMQPCVGQWSTLG